MSIYESLTSNPQNLEEKKYKVYILDNEEIDVEPGKEEEFLRQNPTAKLKSQSIVADPPKTTEPGKPQGANQPQNNQQQQSTESSLEDVSLGSPGNNEPVIEESNKNLIERYNSVIDKYKDPNQSEEEFASSLNYTEEKIYDYGKAIDGDISNTGRYYAPAKEQVIELLGGVHNNIEFKDDSRYNPEKFEDLKFLKNQIDAGYTIKRNSTGDQYDDMNYGELATQDSYKKGHKDLEINNDELDPSTVHPTITEYEDYINDIEEKAFAEFEQKYSGVNSNFTANYQKEYQELVEKVAPNLREDIMKEFESQYKELESSFESIRKEIDGRYEKEFNEKYPNGGTQEQIDAFNDRYSKEVNGAAADYFKDLNDQMEIAYRNQVSEIEEVQNFEANKLKEYERLVQGEFEEYFGKHSGLYNKWTPEELGDIGNQFDADGFQNMNREEKLYYMRKQLEMRLEVMEREDPSVFNLPGEREEYINDYYAHFYRGLATKKETSMDLIRKTNEDGTYTYTREEKERIELTNFYIKGLVEELEGFAENLVADIDYLNADEILLMPAKDFGSTPSQKMKMYGEYEIEANNPIAKEVLRQIYAEGRNKGYEGSRLDKYAAEEWMEKITPMKETMLRYARDVRDNPESINDMANTGFGRLIESMFGQHGEDYIPIGSTVLNVNDKRNIKLVLEKDEAYNKDPENNPPLNRAEKKLLAIASLRSQSNERKKKISKAYNAGEIFAHAVPFVAEFVMTGPGFRAASTATKVGLKRQIAKNISSTARVSKKGEFLFVNKATVKPWNRAVDGLALFAGVGAQTAMQPWRIADNALNYMTPEYTWAFSNEGQDASTQISALTPFSEEGKALGLKDTRDPFAKAWLKGFGMTASEVFTERIGMFLGTIPRKFMNMGKWKGTPLGDLVFNSDTFKAITLGQFARQWGFKRSQEVINWAQKNAGWDGILQEIGEELVNYPLSNLIDGSGPTWAGIRKYESVYDKDGNVVDQKDMGWNWEELGTMALGVGSMGVVFGGLGTVSTVAMGHSGKSYYVNNRRFTTEKAATKYLKRLKKEGKLNSNTDLEVRNDFTTYDKWAGILEKAGLKADQIKVKKPKSNLKITASEVEILSHKDLTAEQQNELRSIDGALKQLNKNPVKNKKEIEKLRARKKKITDPIIAKIIKSKTLKQYRDTIKKVRKIIKDSKLSGKIDIKTVKNGKKGEEFVLDMMGLKRNKKGKIVDKKTGKPRKIRDKEGNEVDIESVLNQMKTAHGYFIPKDLLPEGSKDLMVLNDYLAITKKGENVAAHEFLHFYLSHILEQSPEMRIAMGTVFQDYIASIDPAMVRDGAFRKRLNAYNSADAATRAEEAMAIFLDAIANGSMEYNETMFQKIGNVIRHILQALGVDIKFGEGKDVYNFLKDFNASIQRGELSPALKRALEKKINSTQPGQGTVDATGTIKSIMESEQMKKYIKEDAARVETIRVLNQMQAAFSRMGIKFSMPEDVELTESTAAIVARNEELQDQLLELAEKEGISPKEFLQTRRGDRIKGEILFNNINIAYDLAQKKFIAGVNALKNAGVPNYESKAIPLQDFQQEFVYELTALVNTWDPSITLFPKYVNSKVQTGKSLIESRYQQILQRLKGDNIEAFSLSALQEKGFDYQDQGFGKSTESKKIKGTEVSDKLKIEEDALIALIQSADLSKLEKEKSYKRVKALVKNGSLTPVLKMVGDIFGIPVNKLSKNSDLSDKADDKNYPSQRSKARKFISELAKSNELFNFLPFAQDVDGRSTEIVRTMFGKFYEGSGQRVEVGEGALKKLGQKERFDRKEDVTNEDFFELFGMDKDGNAIKKGTQFDGAIREFVIQLASLMANQSIRKNKEGFTEIGRGRNPLMFSYPESANIIDSFHDNDIGGINKLLEVHGLPAMPKINSVKDIEPWVDKLKSSGVFLLGPKQMFFAPTRTTNKTLGKKTYGSIFTTSSKGVGIQSSKDPVWAAFMERMDKLAEENITYGKGFEKFGLKDSEIWGLRGIYNSVFVETKNGVKVFSPEKARRSKEKIKDFNKKISILHKQMWLRIRKQIQKKGTGKMNAVGIGMYLSMVANDTKHWHKLGAQIVGFSTKVNDYMKGDKMHKGRYEFEHAMPATAAYLYLLNSAMYKEVDFNSSYDFLIQNYRLIALDKAMDMKLTHARTASGKSLQRRMPDDWSVIDGKWWQRYFNDIVEAINGGIDPASIETLDGGTLADMFNINSSGGIKASMPASKVKSMQNINTAFSNVVKFSKTGKTQGMSVFDFDDTLGFTKSGIRATVPNQDGLPKPKRKVIFLAGGAGSGKGNVIKKLGLESMGFKIVNSDISLEWLKKNHGLPENMNELTKEQRSVLGKLGHQARGIAKRKMMKYQGNANGVVVDGTGGSVRSMQKLVDEFKSKGYDVSMLFVDTSLDVALARNKARKERSLLDKIVIRNHEAVQGNKSDFKSMFGNRFMEVNTDKLTQQDPMPNKLVKQMNDFVSSYEKLRLDAAEFAEQGDAILEQGGKFDFSEFNEVVDGSPGPLLDKAKQRSKKYGNKNMFVLTARPQQSAKAIHEFLKSQGLNIPLSNITGLANSTGQAKADWIVEKVSDGYNDIYFVDDAYQNVEAVQNALSQLDVKSDVVQAKIKFSKTGSQEFNKMIERAKGIKWNQVISQAEAKKRGKSVGKWDLYIPPSAEDFKGLLYYFLGKGKQGEADMKFFSDHLLKPFAKGIAAWNTYKQSMANDYKALKKQFKGKVKLTKKLPKSVFTVDSAIRVYLWTKNGFEIPGISTELQAELVGYVENNPDVKKFADALSVITKRKDGYVPPTENWSVETIPTDLRNIVDKIGRKEFLEEWIANKDTIFSPDNMNKIQALYGDGFIEALRDILFRMENGGNRKRGGSRIVNDFTDWINGSVGAIMFFNTRSALLQTISTVNFINWSDNNIFKASAAFANQPQFWKDFVMLFNSDQLKQRRGGLQTDVSASELTKSFAENGYTPSTLISYLLQKGFLPTQLADSFAIAFGGASMYRNRLKTYLKKGMSQKEAHNKAMLDFQEIAEETQQSSREDLISQQQAGPLGRIILAFQNVTMQYGRLTKKALSDLINRRGDTKTNISKIIYYGVAQNIVFAALQNALAFIMWGDDEEEIQNKTQSVANSALDSFLRGTGIYGALVSTLKNVGIQWHLQSQKGYDEDLMKVAQQAVNLSPPIGSKLRKLIQAYRGFNWNKGTSEELGWRIENPKLQGAANLIEALFNVPVARLVNKANNLEEAITGQHETWQRVALALGWSRWTLGVEDEELEEAKDAAKVKQKEIKREEKIEEKKQEEKEMKDKGLKKVQCSGRNSRGKRCGMVSDWTKDKSWKCMHHMEFKDGMDRDGDGIKEYRCTGKTSSGKRCKNKTENKNKRCYAHQ